MMSKFWIVPYVLTGVGDQRAVLRHLQRTELG